MTDEESIHTVVQGLQDAWNDGDGAAFATPYAEDAEFVTVQGVRVSGRRAIGVGHQGIFNSIYAGSTNTMELIDTRAITDEVSIALTRNTLSVPTGPLAGVRQALGTIVLRRNGSGWEIVSTQNTVVEDYR